MNSSKLLLTFCRTSLNEHVISLQEGENQMAVEERKAVTYKRDRG